jgi:hypothetical protein
LRIFGAIASAQWIPKAAKHLFLAIEWRFYRVDVTWMTVMYTFDSLIPGWYEVA